MRLFEDCNLSDEKMYATLEINGHRALFLSHVNERPFIFSNHFDGQANSIRRELGFSFSWIIETRWGGTIIERIRNSFNASSYGCESVEFVDFELSDETLSVLQRLGYLDDTTCEGEAVADSTPTRSSVCDEFRATNYQTTHWYDGFHGYHSMDYSSLNLPIRAHRGHRIGVELEVEFNDEDYRDDFCDIPSNWFYRERDGSLGSYGCEIITIPLLPNDAKNPEFWKPLTDYLKTKATSWDTHTCGLHIHIGREILGRDEEQQSETLGRLLYLYHHYLKDTRLNSHIFGRERGYHDQDGKTDCGNAAQLLGGDVFRLKDIKERVKTSLISRSRTARYFDINNTNPKTIEFRRGRGSINEKRIARVVDYCERLCVYAKITPWTQISYNDLVSYLMATTTGDLREMIERYR